MAEVFDRTGRGVLFVSVLVVTVALLTATGTAAAQSAPDCSAVTYDGDGTESNPYEVSNVDQLQCIEQQGLDENYRQVSDIDASGTSAWNNGKGFEPIGKFNRTRDTEFNGFNGTFDGADYTVSGLTIDRGSAEAVGLFGFVDSGGRLEKVALENVNVSGNSDVGGLVARNRGNVAESYADGSVSGDDFVGGLVGVNAFSTVTESYANGSVSASNNEVGGLVGRNFGTVERSYATRDVSGDDFVGGLVGSNGGTIENSYATGNVSGNRNVGGLVGENVEGTVDESYWDTETTGRATSDGGTGLTTSQMTGSAAKSNMQGFDFTSTWETVPDDYPILAWQSGGNEGANTIGRDSNGDSEGGGGADGTMDNGGDGTAAAQSAPDCSTVTYDGDGTTSNPYEVGNVDQLQCIEEQDLDANYVQVADIDASETEEWNGGDGFDPIGERDITRDTEFTGTFDGADHTISELTIDRESTKDVGVFGFVDSSILENVNLENVDINGSRRVGGLVGGNVGDGTVENSYANSSVSGINSVGGLVGSNDGTVRESYATGGVSSDGNRVGGLVGENILGGTVTESYATGSVSGGNRAGGLVGSNVGDGTVRESYATGSVSGNRDVGGLIGQNIGVDVIVSNSYWDTNTTGQPDSAGSGTGLNTSEMTGDATAKNMQGFDFEGTWRTVMNPDDYPMLAWQTGGNGGTNTESGGQGLPGFTTITALLALLTVVAAAVRRETK